MALVFVLLVCSAVALETWGAPIPILQKFEWTPGVITYGNDDRTVEDVDTADGCAVLCLQESTFICKSFDFRSKEKVCMLSKGNSYTAGVGLRLAAGADLYEVLPDYIPTEVPTTTARPTAAKPTDPTTPEAEGQDDPNAGGLQDQPSAEPVSTKRNGGVDKADQDKETEGDGDMSDGKARRKDREGRRKKKRGKENGEEDNGGKNGRRGRKRGRQGRRNGERKKNRRGKGRNGGNGKRPSKKMDVENTNDVTKTSSPTTPKTTVPPRQTTPDPEPYQTPSPLDSDIDATAVAMTTEIVPSDGDLSETPNSLRGEVDDAPAMGEGNTATATADAGTGDEPSVDGNNTEGLP
ncbi:uncharacterized protein LOC144870698 [Branchiostoma floridae x Branchiostoma japonicum]